MLQVLHILEDKGIHHINDLIEKLGSINKISKEDQDRLIQTNDEKIVIKSFDQKVQIALNHLLVFELINADRSWSLNIEYNNSYKLTNQGKEFVNQNKTSSSVKKIILLKMKMKAIAESIKGGN